MARSGCRVDWMPGRRRAADETLRAARSLAIVRTNTQTSAVADHEDIQRTAGALAALPIIIKVVVVAFAVAIAAAIALGKVGVAIGGGGLAAFVVYAVVSSIVKNRRLRKAMLESDRP